MARLQLTVFCPMRGGCTTCMAMFLSGAVTGTAELIMRNVKRKELLTILGPATGSSSVLRGGSWASYALLCRSAARGGYFPSEGCSGIGFRVVFDP